MSGGSFLSFWYYHLPNFVLAALMYTLLGRVVLGMFVDPELDKLHLALLLQHHRSGCCARRARNSEGGGTGHSVAVWIRLAVLVTSAVALRLHRVWGRS